MLRRLVVGIILWKGVKECPTRTHVKERNLMPFMQLRWSEAEAGGGAAFSSLREFVYGQKPTSKSSNKERLLPEEE
jgi:hypothetical protein